MFKRTVSILLLAALPAGARLTIFVVEQTGPAGASQSLSGRFSGELDPKDPHNALINDIQLAPRNARGMVEYTATFAMIKPAQPNGILWYSVPNRGNGAPVNAPGQISVVSGWQGDVIPRPNLQTIAVPAVKGITGPVIERLINKTELTLNTEPYVALTYQKPATLDTRKATLTRRNSPNAAPVKIPATDWAFADCSQTPFPGVPDETKICLKDGVDSNSEYIVQYTAKDPLVLGIGFAATRDLNSFLRYAAKDDAGNPNPVAGQVKWAIAQGNSQSGNFIRSFLNLGFNQDEANRIVWDGVNPHIAARQLALNFRFAVGGGAAGINEPGSEGVLWWGDYEDEVRHRPVGSLLDRCKATNTCPKIIETFGALEFWYLRESPNLVGTDAKKDIPLPPNVRRYFFPGTSHGGGRGGFSTATPAPPAGCLLPANPNPETETMRALHLALVDWVTKGVEPPPSRYPHLDQLTEKVDFPKIPHVPDPNGLVNSVLDYDFGPDFIYRDTSGVITKEPPTIRRVIPTLVPKVDADGSDVGGVPSVLRSAPLGSYLGWNVVAAGFDKGRVCGLAGGYMPFAGTKAERLAANDPRPSLEERYGTHQGYVEAVRKAAEQAVRERFLLREDADKLIAQAAAGNVLVP